MFNLYTICILTFFPENVNAICRVSSTKWTKKSEGISQCPHFPFNDQQILYRMASRNFSNIAATSARVAEPWGSNSPFPFPFRMPAEFEAYIRLFCIFSSTSKLNICVCSYLDQMALTFTSSLLSPDVQRAFIRTLTKAGIGVAIDTNFSEAINMRTSP